MQLRKEVIKKQKIAVKKARFLEIPKEEKKKSPKVILEFVPNPDFQKEFLGFLETILSWNENLSRNKNFKKEKHEEPPT